MRDRACGVGGAACAVLSVVSKEPVGRTCGQQLGAHSATARFFKTATNTVSCWTQCFLTINGVANLLRISLRTTDLLVSRPGLEVDLP